MDKQLYRTPAALLALTVLLTVGLAGCGSAPRQTQPPVGEDPAEPSYTALTCQTRRTTLSFQLEDGHWLWSGDPEFPLDETYVLEILNLMTQLKPRETLSDPQPLETYHLEDPLALLEVTCADGSTHTLSFGKADESGDNRFLMVDQEEAPLYLVPDPLFQSLSRPIYEMCRLPALPDLDPAALRTITVRGARTTELTGKDGVWHAGDQEVTEAAPVAALLELLPQLKVDACADFKPSEEAAEICGFDHPAAVLEVSRRSSGEDPWTLTVGTTTPNSKDSRYVRLAGDSTIYRMSGLEPLLTLAKQGLD